CCIIAKDEENLIYSCINYITPLVDEVIVCVDTQTKDKTKEIAEKAGAKVYDYDWEDDFSKARNFAKSKATSSWIICLDADERILAKDIEDLKKVIKNEENKKDNKDQEVVAFSFLHRYYTKEKQKSGYASWRKLQENNKEELTKEFPEIKQFEGYFDIFPVTYMFKNHPKIYFTGSVHEDVQPSIVKWDKEEPKKIIVQCTILIHHFHFIKNKVFVDTKQKHYFDLSKEKFKQNPDAKIALDLAAGYIFFENDLSVSFNYLVEMLKQQPNITKEQIGKLKKKIQNKKYIPALHNIMQMIDLKKHNPNDIFNLVKAYMKREQYKLALVVLKRLFIAAPKEPVIIEHMGVCYDKITYTEDAIKVFEHGIIVHPTNASFYFNLGALYEKTKEWHKAVSSFQYAINNEHPLKKQLIKRIEMLKKVATGQHVNYNINIG
ncbi:hypothetical protein COV16_01760, partial [Candidatus Woesearchaeota archaeon CG10_big_fil_rev_8_21_14_0_10_34_8]